MDPDNILKTLNELTRSSLSKDGFQLKLKKVDSNGVVKVLLEAQEGACIDCLVPDEILIELIEMKIRSIYPELKYVELIKGFS